MGNCCKACEGNLLVYEVPTLTLNLAARDVILWLTKHNLIFHRQLYHGGTDANYTLVGIPRYWSAKAQSKVLRSVTNRNFVSLYSIWEHKHIEEPSVEELEKVFCKLQ
jgi:hypothetical protein